MATWDIIKQSLGKKAIEYVPERGLIGLGSGTTSEWFIRALAEDVRSHNKEITCLATSIQSESLARSLGLKMLPFHMWNDELVDLLVDGADAIDQKGNMIKGLGGALFREKLVALSSKRYLILVDERKKQEQLNGILPIEIAPFGIQHTLERIHAQGFTGAIRKEAQGENFITDNENLILDIQLQEKLTNPEEINTQLKAISGVIETGFFLHFKLEVCIGYLDGRITQERHL